MKQQTQHDDIKDTKLEESEGKAEIHEVDVWKEKYVRALADYQNLEKRTREEQRQTQLFASLVVIEKLLPIVDLLEKTYEHLQDQGLELALKEVIQFFRSVGVEKIDVLGKPFDPFTMDCIEIVEGAKENSVVSILSPGYQMHGKIIRPAKVTVGKKKEEENSIHKE